MPKWTNNEEKILQDKYGNIKIEELEKLLPNHTRQAIQKWAQKLNLKGNSSLASKRYTHDEHFFDSPNILNCYWAGFIAADGCVTDDGLLSFSLSRKDRSILEKFTKCINFTGPLKDYCCDGKYYSRLQIWGAHNLKKSLFDIWNITLRKSLTLQPPNLNDISHIYSYIIGYFDGDGSFWLSCEKKSERRRPNISFCGTQSMMNWINNQLLPISGRLSTISQNGYSTNNKNIRFCSSRCIKIHKFLCGVQPDISIRLERKWRVVYE